VGNLMPAAVKKGSKTQPKQRIDAACLLQLKLKGVSDRSGKKQRLHGSAAEAVAFDELHSGGSRTEAARLFFELLVLQSRKKVGYVLEYLGQQGARSCDLVSEQWIAARGRRGG